MRHVAGAAAEIHGHAIRVLMVEREQNALAMGKLIHDATSVLTIQYSWVQQTNTQAGALFCGEGIRENYMYCFM